jgi:predicted DNA-binding transcriptional regulator YafY
MHNQHKLFRVLQLINLLKAQPPKSIRYLSNFLQSTERTVYRYLDLLEEVGFLVERDEHLRVFIRSESSDDNFRFTKQEVAILKRLLLTTGRDNQWRDSILRKIQLHSDVISMGDDLLKVHIGKIVEALSDAILRRKQVVLKGYHSLNTNKVTDRLVEPVRFTDQYKTLCAYEIKTDENKLFNVERISSVSVSRRDFQHAEKHQFSVPDVFGFQPARSGRQFLVRLSMTLRATVLMREEFPMTAPLIAKERRGETYSFQATVNDLRPLVRFLLGLPEDVTIRESAELREAIRKTVGRLVDK